MTDILDHCTRCGSTCCNPLMDLKLTPDEFQRVFSQHAAVISIVDEDGYCEVTADGDGGCPNLLEGKCSVYHDRPVECRLFPYSIQSITRKGDMVTAYVHGGARICPSKQELLCSEQEARSLVLEFLAGAYPGLTHHVHLERNPNYNKLRLMRLGRMGQRAISGLLTQR